MRGLCLALAWLTVVTAVSVSCAPASELSQLITKGNHVIALNRLGLTAAQLDELAPLSDELVGAGKSLQANRQSALTGAHRDLAQVRETLLKGKPLSEAQQASLDQIDRDLEMADNSLYSSAVSVLDQVREVMLPQQNALIDWTPPRGAGDAVCRETPLQRAQREYDQRAMYALAKQFLSRCRYLSVLILGTENLVDDFLRPLIPPGAPVYPQAREFMLRLVEEVRLLPEPQWEDEQDLYAARLVEGLQLEQPRGGEEMPEQMRPYAWADMYEILSDPGTPMLLRAMSQARRGGQGAPPNLEGEDRADG